MKGSKLGRVRVTTFRFTESMFIMSVFAMIFSGLLSLHIAPFFSYTDEVVASWTMLAGFWLTLKRQKVELGISFKIVILYAVFSLLGICGNLSSHYQSSSAFILLDIFAWAKIPLVYVCASVALKKTDLSRLYKTLAQWSKLFSVVLVILAFSNQVFQLQLAEGYSRFGLEAFTFPGTHPTYIVAVCACMISLLCVEYRKNRPWIFLLFLVCLDTLRFKAIGYVFLMIFAALFMKRRIHLPIAIGAILSVIIIAYRSIVFYFVNDEAARGRLLRTSLQIFRRFLPWGSGFATFGDTYSIKSYSYAYIEYGLSQRYGFSKEYPSYLSDGGWATPLGQFGLLGMILYVYILYIIFRTLYKACYHSRMMVPFISCFGYMAIASSSENPFSADYACLYAITLSMITLLCTPKTPTLSQGFKHLRLQETHNTVRS